MKIDLKKVPFYVINLKEDEKRRVFMKEQLDKLGYNYTFIDAIKSPRPIGIALSHYKTLLMDIEPPFVILEDDCQFIDNFNETFDVPDNTDAIYLGHSCFGLKKIDQYNVRWGGPKLVKYSQFNKDFLKIECMLARHAIIYISKNFQNAAIEANKKSLFKHFIPIPGDISYAEMQKDYLVLSPNNPICYQSGKHNGNEWNTIRSVLTYNSK